MRTLATQSIGLVFLFVLALYPIGDSTMNWTTPEKVSFDLHSVDSSQYMVSNVPYIWQEVNGLCAWAALTMVFQHFGVDATLAQILDVSGVGFAFYYVRADPTLLFYPGPLGSQIPDSEFLADTFGMDVTWYFGEDTPGIGQLKSVLEQQGMSVTVFASFMAGFEQLKQDLANNTPLVISVNPLRFSTIRDYQALGLPPGTLAAHGVVAVGYNDTHVFIHDPGVGSFGTEYGYPTDQRGTTVPIPLEDFQRAWEDRALTAYKFLPTQEPQLSVEALRSLTIERIIAKLEGDYHAYAYAPVPMWLGADAFVQMGEDLQPTEFEAMLTSWDTYFGNRTQLVSTLTDIKSAYLGSLTLTHEAMKRAATDLFEVLHNLNSYSTALNFLTNTLDLFEALVDPAVLHYPADESKRTTTTLFDEAFNLMVQTLSEGQSIEQTVQTATSQLEALSSQITSMGATLIDFSSALKEAPSTTTSDPVVGEQLNLQVILPIALLGGIIVIVVGVVKRKVQRYDKK